MHKDPYENIYCVVSGEKNFILHPPTDLPWIPYLNYPSAVYKEYEPGKWIIESLANETPDLEGITSTPWICVDPLNPDYEKFSHTHICIYIYSSGFIFKMTFIFEIKRLKIKNLPIDIQNIVIHIA